jgi:type I restriction enzyme M protein
VSRISQSQLEYYLWGAAEHLRGSIDAGDYKQFIFPLLFLKRLCDVHDEETAQALRASGGDAEFAAFAENHRFQVPPEAHWKEIRKETRNVGQAIQRAMRAIESANKDKLFGIFGDAQWSNKDRLSDETMRELIEHFSSLELTIANLPEDELGQGYEFLIKKFADDSGHTAAEFYTNRTVVHLMTEMLDVQPGESVYDPTCGSGGMLMSCVAHLKKQGKEWRNVRLFGQERNLMTSSIARMNCFLHGIEDFRIERGDTLAEPKLVEGDKLMQFDVVLANPPYSIKQWDREAFRSDPWGRNLFGVPPQGRADYAFQQHINKSLKPKTGRCAVLWPNGVLFRQEEQEIRSKLIEADLIECVIGLGPNLFYNSPMEACILICRTQKERSRKGKILFINAVSEVSRERSQSFLTEEHQRRIIACCRDFSSSIDFSKVVDISEIRSNEYSLSMSLYALNKEHGRTALKTESADHPALTNFFESSARLRANVTALLGEKTVSHSAPNAGSIKTPGWLDRLSWSRVKFEELVEHVRETGQPSPSDAATYIGLEHLESGTLHVSRWGSEADLKGKKLIMRKGDVLFAKRNAYLRRVAIAPHDGFFSAHGMIFRPKKDKVCPEFLPFFMMSDKFMNRCVAISVGSLSPTINWSELRRQEFDLPPLDQQRRIADILWAAYNSIGFSLNQSILTLRKSAHSEVFVHGINNATACHGIPSDWKETTVGAACRIVNSQRKPINSSERAKIKGEYPYYGPTGVLDYLNQYNYEGQYVLIGEDGDHFLKYDRWNMTQITKGRFNVNNHAHVLTGTPACKTEWIFQYFKHRDITPFLSKQGSGRMKMQKAVLEKLPIALPPLKEQDEILSFLSNIDSASVAVNNQIHSSKALIGEFLNSLLGIS